MKFLKFVFNSFIFVSILFSGLTSGADEKSQILNEINDTVSLAQPQLMNSLINKKYWFYPLYLGSMYTSQYILLRHWLELSFQNNSLKFNELPPSRLNEEYFRKFLLQTQLKDGSWQIIYDANMRQGDLNTTILHYAALKVMVLNPDEAVKEVLQKAKAFILKSGGVEKSSLFTKIALSLFGNYPWSKVPSIPYLVFNENFSMNYKRFGQWIGPHLFPISYLRKLEAKKQLGSRFDLSELWIETPHQVQEDLNKNFYSSSYKPTTADRDLIINMLDRQKENGSFGGYTTASLFSAIAFQNYQHFSHDLDSRINPAIARALEFVDNLYFNAGSSSYLGVTCEGRYWDTALIGQGLLESGMATQNLKDSTQYLLSVQDKKSGGFGFGLDFETYMDTDDTAEILLYLHKAGIKNADTDKAIQWLFSMQNDDGGWGAFDRNNNGNLLLDFATRDFLDSADMFDESSADVTGHILEALAAYDYTVTNSESVRKAVDYLLKTQEKQLPAWLGRWGSNYVYGTSAGLIGLAKAGVDLKSEKIVSSVKWLIQCQNKDGGYGESWASYTNINQACKGISTPSQTAWALMALIETGHADSEAAQNAARYLTKSFKARGNKFVDLGTFVGTGHPKIVPMHYPSYAWGFSMMALSRYRDYLTGQ
ncbi:MAG: prenyltransferase/squalene oxidase repeat-containing protein [Pseudobdellovibrionaceae bacterium]